MSLGNSTSVRNPECPEWLPEDFELEKVVSTHVSQVYIGRNEVYKLKRCVDLEFVDHSKLATRIHSCFEEIRLNVRLAKDVYLGVRFVLDTGAKQELGPLQKTAISAPKNTVDAVVCMKRLRDVDTLRAKLSYSKDQPLGEQVKKLAESVAKFHKNLLAISSASVAQFTKAARANLADLRKGYSQDKETLALIEAVSNLQDEKLSQLGEKFTGRIKQGFIRDGHGDLRLEHIYFSEEQTPTDSGKAETLITIIDCIEFSESLRVADVLSDMCFLAMELDLEKHGDLSKIYLNEYKKSFPEAFDQELLAVYMAYRALVRAKVEQLQALEDKLHLPRSKLFIGLAYRYLCFGVSLNEQAPLIICGGPIGVGKSTLARRLSQVIAAQYFSSDDCRIEIFGESKASRSLSYSQGRYQAENKAKIYKMMCERAAQQLRKGVPVVLDATFSRKEYRDICVETAESLGSKCISLSCRADEETLRKRLRARALESGVSSDGREEILSQHLAEYEWPTSGIVIDASKQIDVFDICRQLSKRIDEGSF